MPSGGAGIYTPLTDKGCAGNTTDGTGFGTGNAALASAIPCMEPIGVQKWRRRGRFLWLAPGVRPHQLRPAGVAHPPHLLPKITFLDRLGHPILGPVAALVLPPGTVLHPLGPGQCCPRKGLLLLCSLEFPLPSTRQSTRDVCTCENTLTA